MEAKLAQKIHSELGMVDRKTSQAILRSIVMQKPLPESLTPNMERDAQYLREKYLEIKDRVPSSRARNWPFYLMIKERYDDFDFESTADGTIMNFRVKGIKPSLFSLLTKKFPKSTLEQSEFVRLPSDARGIVENLYQELKLIAPTVEHKRAFVSWLNKGLQGEPLTIISPVCPDYSTENIEDEQSNCSIEPGMVAKRHRFTFEGVGTGLGVTATHLFTAMPSLHEALVDHLGVDLTHVVCPGDFEGFSEENCHRLGVEKEEFLRQVELQSDSIRQESPRPIRSMPFTHLCGGEQGWQRICDTIETRFEEGGDLYPVKLSPETLQVALGRKQLYDRWFEKPNSPNEFYVDLVCTQAVEYGAMGQAIDSADGIVNPLILGADDHKMGRFYGLTTDIPVLYLPRIYL